MNLSDIPTPLTDAFSAAIFDLPTDLAFAKTVDFASDLERQLTALRSYTGSQTFRSDFRTADELRAAYDEVRQQNAVLREALEKAVRAMEWYAWHKEEDHDCMEYRAVTAARAALAATEEFSSATTTCEHSGITFPTRP